MKRQNSLVMGKPASYLKRKSRSNERIQSPNAKIKSIMKSITSKAVLTSYDSNDHNNKKYTRSPPIKYQYYTQPANTERTYKQRHQKSITKTSNKFNNNSPEHVQTSNYSSRHSRQNSSANLKQSKSKLDTLLIMEGIGNGKFGKVYKCQSKTTKKYFALKTISKQQIELSQLKQQLLREVTIQKQMKHSNILKIHDFFDDSENHYLLLEYAPQGSLFQSLVKQQQKRYSEPFASCIVRQVAQGIKYLHENHVIHRDLKPENILWGEDGYIKISDFGWAIQNREQRETLCGTLDYLSPEMVYGQGYDKCIDVWALGVLIYELTTGKTPFHVSEAGFTELNFPTHLSGDVKNLMAGLLQDKSKRKSIDWALNHVWLTPQTIRA